MANFSVAARTLIHLGAELITSDEIALYELIKNSFDAGSKRIKIKIVFLLPISKLAVAKNILKDKETKSFSEKIDNVIDYLKKNTNESQHKNFIKIISELLNSSKTDQANDVLDKINFIEIKDAGCGMTRDDLNDVFLRIGTDSKLNKRNKNAPERPLLGNKGIGRLAMMRLGKKATVTSWVSGLNDANTIYFNWNEFEDPKKSIDEIDFPILNRKKPEYSESGTIIRITCLEADWSEKSINDGLIEKHLRRLRNPFEENKLRFPIDVSFNNEIPLAIKKLDEELWALADQHLIMNLNPSNIKESNNVALTIEITDVKHDNKTDYDSRTFLDVSDSLELSIKDLKDIGPIRLVIRWYNRRKLAGMGLGSDLKRLRDELDNWSGGIAIYRDEFRVGVSGSDKDGDWFNLDKKALKGGGFFLNSIQTIGALEISADKNPHLIDRSNREGLIENKITSNLIALISKFAIATLKEKIKHEGEMEKKQKLTELAETGTEHIEDKIEIATKNLSVIRKKVPKQLHREVAAIDENLHYISTHVKKYNQAMSMLREQRENILELAGVGTVMNSVLHELTRTTTQTRSLLDKISKSSSGVTKDLLMKLEAEVKSINTRLRQLDPLSTNGRQGKVKFDANKLIKTILEGYSSRFLRHEIEVLLTVDEISTDKSVIVKMVRGFFCLAIENLLSNSVYWLNKRIMPGHTSKKIYINIDSKANVISISDTGPGIASSDRERIFEPGFSLKKDGKGFGLYIAKEVAMHHGSIIELDKEASDDGRLRTFYFQLPMEKL
ncbi:MAG: ATP-binding protein [Gammaproteobacteria bacterium]|nr:ATP-binding protein [Gammaproteobacteria bacterium]